MDKLNKKLSDAFNNNDHIKIKKYLNLGADVCVETMYKYAVANDDIELLDLLLLHNTNCIKKNKDIINIGCIYNSSKCLKKLLDYIDMSDYDGSSLQFVLKEITCN